MRVLTPTPEALATLERLRAELKWRAFDEPTYRRQMFVRSPRVKVPKDFPAFLKKQAD